MQVYIMNISDLNVFILVTYSHSRIITKNQYTTKQKAIFMYLLFNMNECLKHLHNKLWLEEYFCAIVSRNCQNLA